MLKGAYIGRGLLEGQLTSCYIISEATGAYLTVSYCNDIPNAFLEGDLASIKGHSGICLLLVCLWNKIE